MRLLLVKTPIAYSDLCATAAHPAVRNRPGQRHARFANQVDLEPKVTMRKGETTR